ncbi:Zn-ribbon domain-containing OB-fold protein [Nocardioides humi]|uniref:ChsH2 C-terminal OB-fold domain-containing protein n=1 Tax=Nocardioides humi TaxID=449461 RepID=A0ABN1ZW54_9ACTN|nr:OB-fold domain-containing protein [Nocardioides humi]
MTSPDLDLEPGIDPDAWRGRRCRRCATVAYGAAGTCPRCLADDAEVLELSLAGVVWTTTVQRFAPKSPPYVPPADGFRPFAVVYVELPEGLRVEGVVPPSAGGERRVAIGDRVRLVATGPVPTFEPEERSR